MKELPYMHDDKAEEASKIRFICPECQTGVLHLQHITYFTWLNNELITVPNFPAWVCDVCGRRHYDARAKNWLNAILDPDAGERLKRKPKPNHHKTD